MAHTTQRTPTHSSSHRIRPHQLLVRSAVGCWRGSLELVRTSPDISEENRPLAAGLRALLSSGPPPATPHPIPFPTGSCQPPTSPARAHPGYRLRLPASPRRCTTCGRPAGADLSFEGARRTDPPAAPGRVPLGPERRSAAPRQGSVPVLPRRPSPSQPRRVDAD